MHAVSDEQLMKWLQAGDKSCLGALFERHQKALYNYCVRLTKDREAAEDVVQDTFFKVMKKKRSWRGDGTFKSWLFHIARNAAFDHLRRAQRFGALPQQPTDIETDDRSPERASAGVEFTEHVIAAMESLPTAAREIIWLGRFEFENYQELANVLACSPGAAKVRMHRAMKQLKENLSQLTDEVSYEPV